MIMKLPKPLTEEEFLKILNQVTKKLILKFRFPGYTKEDLYQECFIMALDGIKNWDKQRPLSNFLYIHLKNRLCNFKRKYYIRIEKPCEQCPFNAFVFPDKCKKYKDLMKCHLYYRWYQRNITRRNLAHFLEYSQVIYNNKHTEKNMEYEDNLDVIDYKEIFHLLDRELPVNLRKLYLIVKNGGKISKKNEQKLRLSIRDILHHNGYVI